MWMTTPLAEVVEVVEVGSRFSLVAGALRRVFGLGRQTLVELLFLDRAADAVGGVQPVPEIDRSAALAAEGLVRQLFRAAFDDARAGRALDTHDQGEI